SPLTPATSALPRPSSSPSPAPATTPTSALSLHDALPILPPPRHAPQLRRLFRRGSDGLVPLGLESLPHMVERRRVYGDARPHLGSAFSLRRLERRVLPAASLPLIPDETPWIITRRKANFGVSVVVALLILPPF